MTQTVRLVTNDSSTGGSVRAGRGAFPTARRGAGTDELSLGFGAALRTRRGRANRRDRLVAPPLAALSRKKLTLGVVFEEPALEVVDGAEDAREKIRFPSRIGIFE